MTLSQRLGLPGLHSEFQRQLTREAKDADKRNKIQRDKENRKTINASRHALKEQRRSDFKKTTVYNLKKLNGQLNFNLTERILKDISEHKTTDKT
jgi:hypothetical protein